MLVEVLMGLVSLLRNRLLALSASSHLSAICSLLCQSVSLYLGLYIAFIYTFPSSASSPSHISSQLDNQSGFVQQTDRPGRQTEDDLTTYIYPVLTTFCTYGAHLDRAAKVMGCAM